MLSTSRNFLIDSNIQLWLETALGDQVRFQGCVFSRVTQLLSVFSTVSKLFCVFFDRNAPFICFFNRRAPNLQNTERNDATLTPIKGEGPVRKPSFEDRPEPSSKVASEGSF